MKRSWPRLMDVREIADFTGWTPLAIQGWIRTGELSGARTVGDTKKLHIPRELLFSQLDPRPIRPQP